MPLISVTRLRLRRWWYLPPFVIEALRSQRQATAADGNLHVALLRDRHLTFWTATSWTSEAAMKAFMHATPHGPAMRKLMDWCDEASVAHWTEDGGDLPSWDEAHRRLQKEGRASKVRHPSAAHAALNFPSPVSQTTARSQVK